MPKKCAFDKTLINKKRVVFYANFTWIGTVVNKGQLN